MPNHRSKLTDAIDSAPEQLADKGPFTAEDVARVALEALTPEDCWNLALDYATVAARRRIRRAMLAADPRQGWLALPEYEHVPQVIEVDCKFLDINECTVPELHQVETKLEARIKSYDFARRAEERLKRDNRALDQIRKLRHQIVRFTAGDPGMKVGKAIGLYRASLETPTAQHYRAIASKGGKAKSGRTKNQ